MTDADQHLMTLFAAALECGSDVERATYLDRACADDLAVRERLEALLRAHGGAGRFLEATSDNAPTADARPPGPVAGTVLGGRYKLLEVIGEGGMGEVWLTQQQEPVKRSVALKLIKAGMDSQQVLARFEAERQALALMDHPNIAKVLDAGATPEGRPFFVMELVKGTPITRYCDDHHLTPRQRLELFVSVCQAVQHAHQKGVIHRDLKPSNVLVAPYDGRPVPKVIDFGVAKAAGQPLTDKTLLTGLGAVVGTPEYMSPEQAELNNQDIDTRSDVYSLGVLMYELLVGSPPFSRKELEKAGMLEMLRVIREQEPSKPSTKLSTADGLPTLAANRGTEPAKLTKLVRGELDWIVMKALEKDRNRRYETANGFATDVQRYLADEPVQACPPSVGYRLRKFARRNRRAVATASAMALTVVVGVVGLAASTLLIAREQRTTEKALQAERRAKDDLVQTLYYQWVGSAVHERAKDRHAHAEELLDQCPPDLRGWEWHYLKRLPFAGLSNLPHGDIVNSVAWSSDGRLLASGSRKGWVKVWDARTGALLRHLHAQKGFVRGLAFSPDGRFVATGGEDDRVNLWDVGTGGLLRDFRTGAGTTLLLALEFSPDGRHLAAADHDRNVRLWDVANGSEVRLPDDLLVTWGLAFTPDGRQIVTVNTEGVVMVWDVGARRTAATFRAGTRASGYRVAFSRDRRLLAIGCEDGTITVIKTDPLEEVRTLEAHTAEISGLAFGDGDGRLASTGDDLIVKIWDLRTGQEALALDILTRRANSLAFSPDGHRLAVGAAEGAVQILDGTPLAGPGDAGQAHTLEGHGDAVVGLAYSPDCGSIVSASRDGTAKVWDARTAREVLTFHGHRAALTGVAWQPRGGRVVSASWDGTARVWDPATGVEVLPPLNGRAGSVHGLSFDRDGGVLATAHHDGSVRVWDVVTGRQRVCISPAHGHPVLGVTFSPDGGRLVSAGGGDNLIKVWDWRADPPRLVRSLEARQNIIRNPLFSPDGRRLVAVVATPARVWTWDVSTGTGKPRELLDTWRVSQALIGPGGRLAVVSSGRVQFLDADGSDGPALIGCHAGGIGCAAFSPDGRHLATGAGYKGRGEVRIWDVGRWERALKHQGSAPPDGR
jgi:WD40 repeat protein/serine/threonine protein kinase